jgi:protein TonB
MLSQFQPFLRRYPLYAFLYQSHLDRWRSHPPSRTRRRRPNPATPSREPWRAAPDELHNDPPAYSDESRLAHEEGVVILRVEVTADGEAASVTVQKSSGSFRLDQAARQAVKQWRFHPGSLAGVPVPSAVIVPVNFKLE